jgi:hypothetical protein
MLADPSEPGGPLHLLKTVEVGIELERQSRVAQVLRLLPSLEVFRP